MTELGESADARSLVPGDAEAVRALARSFTAYAGDLREASGGLRAIDATSAWRGPAADAFRDAFAIRPRRWAEAGDAFTEAARALAVHAETLDWAQGQAAEAARLRAAGEPSWSAARDVLDRARAQLRASGDDAAARVARATAAAPLTPWGHVEALGDAALDVGAGVVDAAASVGNAALHDPGSIAAVVGGAALMAAGAGGAAGGALATASGVGAPVGVPATAASIGLVVSGAALAGAGAVTVAQSAAGPDRVSPAGSDGSGTAPTPQPAAQMPQVENRDLTNIVKPLYRGVDKPGRLGDGTTGAAVRAERATGQATKDKFHSQKANNSVRALRRWLYRNRAAAPSDRGVAQNELDNLLDALGRTR